MSAHQGVQKRVNCIQPKYELSVIGSQFHNWKHASHGPRRREPVGKRGLLSHPFPGLPTSGDSASPPPSFALPVLRRLLLPKPQEREEEAGPPARPPLSPRLSSSSSSSLQLALPSPYLCFLHQDTDLLHF